MSVKRSVKEEPTMGTTPARHAHERKGATPGQTAGGFLIATAPELGVPPEPKLISSVVVETWQWRNANGHIEHTNFKPYRCQCGNLTATPSGICSPCIRDIVSRETQKNPPTTALEAQAGSEGN